ncbi:L-seryl-tRNA(Sec) selenium transferase [Helicobacter sp. MIT 99-5507]|uniref:L-seryl-tRNA(Sec) selenium transferase n=1 Tax=Helicobacter sp. MIT 99-5507 TaxID=152489 RepID=UPI000E1E6E49|nr:L-seryl-tRNA(Sec) selenium transferase [Helicobacter sp. MIT 99-5507]RDU58511.1 L-seryl-tRNA(Sec) selenium transferase [Helicobacter sp. MIT 99-5507]
MQDLKKIPQIEKILKNPIFKNTNKTILKNITIEKINNLREKIKNKENYNLESIESEIMSEYNNITLGTLKPIINATGVVLQTNLGRSIFHKNLLDEVIPLLSHYNNLEYDLKEGKRGERYDHLTSMLKAMFNVESALVVNNNAAAVLLILNTFAKDLEVIVSRGELIEIGGSFRIQEVMKSAGAKLIEVGSTNKTHLKDYKNAINEHTKIIMKAHKSNFEILGFSSEVDIKEISKLCKEFDLIDYYDLGSGYIKGIECNEPSLLEICKNPPSLLSFSGDKLFGSIQAGIILGKKDLIDKLKQNHMLRALRVDKITILLLQATLKRYITENIDEIPTINMLRKDLESLHKKAKLLHSKIPSFFNPKIIEVNSLAGGGSLPNKEFKSFGITLQIDNIKALKLERILRENYIIARIFNNKVTLDVRSIQDDEIQNLINILESIKNMRIENE